MTAHAAPPGIGRGLLRVGAVVGLAYVLIAMGAGWLQVVDADRLSRDPRDPIQLAAARTTDRGRILDARGVVVAADTRSGKGSRRYPHPAMAPITGYDSPMFGTAGLERTYDRELTGTGSVGPGGDLLRKFRAQPLDPVDLRLSVDVRFQELAMRLLGDQHGAVVAIEPRTGRVLALASSPGYDPARLADPATGRAYLAQLERAAGSPLLDRATQGRYVPGSVFKLVTASAGVEAGAIDTATTFADQPKQSVDGFRVDGFLIRDAPRDVQLDHPLDLDEAMEVSSNIWFAHAGLLTGAQAFTEMASRLGLGAAIRFDLPTVASQLDDGRGPLDGFADRVELANAAYGQAQVLVTPLQMALVAAAIANDGVLMAPTVVDRQVAASGAELVTRPTSLGRVMSSATAATVRDAMVQAVEGRYAGHYAGGAKVDGVATAGKSGTAQLAPGEAPHSWFVGFAPADDPSIVVAVVVEHAGSGSERAVPLGGRLMSAWLRRFAGDGGS